MMRLEPPDVVSIHELIQNWWMRDGKRGEINSKPKTQLTRPDTNQIEPPYLVRN
jgi:hypothetical protein